MRPRPFRRIFLHFEVKFSFHQPLVSISVCYFIAYEITCQTFLGSCVYNKKTRLKSGLFCLDVLVVTAAAAAVSSEERAERAVFAHTVRKSRKKGPAATRKDARREHAAARSQNEQDDENPKIAVIAEQAIHKFPPSPQSICIVFCLRFYTKSYAAAG